MTHRLASPQDCLLLATLNHQLLEDERHRTRLAIPELEQRMKQWLATDYQSVIFEHAGQTIGYALYRPEPGGIYLRQLFIAREHRRRGFGREAVRLLRDQIWPPQTRLTVDVLVKNTSALQFWRAIGFQDYSLTLEIPSE